MSNLRFRLKKLLDFPAGLCYSDVQLNSHTDYEQDEYP
jgi:hypothetical protein